MKNLLFLLLLTFFISCSNEEYDIYSQPVWSPTENGYKLVWEDNFDGVDIDMTKWAYRAVGKRRHNAIVDPSTIYQEGGHLVIELREKNGEFYVGQLTTQNKHLFKYGYFECNVLLNQKAGMHSAFWLQSDGVVVGGDTSLHGAEIDIFEYMANQPGMVYSTIFWDYKDLKSVQKVTIVPQVSTGFHTFGVEWTPEEYIFYIDNRQVWRTSSAVSHIEEYIVLSTEYNGWGGEANPRELPDRVVFFFVKFL
ncbi:MAG: glycoside hydrolase family 16 protein [Prevotella sp.]|jgi:beta-glucanase (GH16 family)|nr:glycoside hydrolase family 16 protein [Prevotella sp.]